MKTRPFLAVGLLIGLSACKKADSVILVNASINPDVSPIYSLRVSMSSAQTQDSKVYPAKQSATAIPTSASLVIVLPRSRSGRVDLAVDGVDNAGINVAHGTAQAVIVVGGSVTTTVVLTAGPTLCGNDSIEPGETCDDGNQFSFDGCDFRCQVEIPMRDAGVPDTSVPEAGNLDSLADGPDDMARMDAPSFGNDGGPEIASDTEVPADLLPPQLDAPPTQPDSSVGFPLGQTCTTKEQCASGNCADGVCCQSPCASVCMVCNLPTSPGQCVMAPAGLDPRGECTQDLASTCGRDGTCDGNGGCRLWPDGTECASATCSAGTASAARTCDGAGTCRAASSKTCAPYACKGTACATQCSGNSDCDAGSYISVASYCSGGTCLRRQYSGSCTSAIQCAAGQYCNLGLQTCAGAVCTCPASCPYSCISNDGYACSCP